ncbi:GNAT family N-acetyltransferase [Pseudomonas cannabina]|uniref:GNAT family acetyltransferase n=3 Tax=Pseudomonas syringae group TaxID=136849 RepID=A0A3M3RSK3_PSECA|nr:MULTISPECIES: GNAT family N-acetyltransferase [Pseudomonas syringae group]KPB69692.1 GNAT family acetyltransferase [Pseudomonas syringae pv. maculicola]KPW19435.1 GNAT family acetyltransferase [Pseudomonas cannabina pv. alisalensis]MBM0142086.1 GNAT family N-acetyltransferase [Pseudomonas cannabina pv. alisalensis]QHE97878.1 GNAT family N-acetyltransferase [Pseudomonas syringae pv. maculicola str. ES4326]QQN23886.1 GNAT family N-acetyltransferase [Pseudomonas cannabina pv. alisalensis]
MPTTSDTRYQYRPVEAADIPAAHALSVHLKWPHREEDWAMVQRTSEGFVAECDGQLVGVAFTCHQGDWSSIGLVIVSDEHQGKGIGRRLMNLCLEATAPRTPILNATELGAPLYRSLGFVDFTRIQQHQGIAQLPETEMPSDGLQIRTLDSADHPQLIQLANAGSGLDRTVVLTDLLRDAEQAVGIEHDGHLQGVALLRRFGRGHIIGPLVAQDLGQARQMISHLLQLIPGQFVRFDILADCGLASWLESLGLPCVDRAPRMVLGTPPPANPDVQQFALVTQAIG